METVTLSKDGLELILKIAGPKVKKKLKELVGSQLEPKDIKDRVKSFEDACKVLSLDPNMSLPFDAATKDDYEKGVNAFAKLSIICKALNEGWKPDWTDDDQLKYYPWFRFIPGSGFSYDDYDYVRTLTRVGSRLCFKTDDLATYAGKQFLDIYNEFLNTK